MNVEVEAKIFQISKVVIFKDEKRKEANFIKYLLVIIFLSILNMQE